MRTDSLLDRPTIPSAYLALLLELLAERGIPIDRFGDDLGLRRAISEDPDARLSGREWGRAVLRALELTRDRGLGYEYGLRMRPTVHGVLGFATMTSATMRDAVAVSTRFFRARQAHFELSIEESNGLCRWILRERSPIPVPELRAFFVQNIVIGVARGIAMNLGRELDSLPEVRVWFDGPAPSYFPDWHSRLPFVDFDRPSNAVVFPASFLSRRPPLADPNASRQAIELCERELAIATHSDGDLVARVRAMLDASDDGAFPQQNAVADAFSMSTRTMKRHLAREGTSYLALLEATRRARAERMLGDTDVAIRELAALLGYENPANFSRAFHRWTGESPSAWRARTRR